MIKKVAIAQWMRLAFPEDLSSMPYEESEAWNVEKAEAKPQEKEVLPIKSENTALQSIVDGDTWSTVAPVKDSNDDLPF